MIIDLYFCIFFVSIIIFISSYFLKEKDKTKYFLRIVSSIMLLFLAYDLWINGIQYVISYNILEANASTTLINSVTTTFKSIPLGLLITILGLGSLIISVVNLQDKPEEEKDSFEEFKEL